MKTIIPECYSSGYNIHLSTHQFEYNFFFSFYTQRMKKVFLSRALYKILWKKMFSCMEKKNITQSAFVLSFYSNRNIFFNRTKSEAKLH